MSNSSLRMMGSQSAGRKEENMFKVFAYLNTRKEFNPMLIQQKVGVTPKTIENYLKQIQEAQMLKLNYQKHLQKPFEEQWYAQNVGVQLEWAKSQYELWLKRQDKVFQKKDSIKQQLKQFQFDVNGYIPKDELYVRLEKSLLLFSFMNAPKNAKLKKPS